MTHPRKATRDAIKDRLAGLARDGVELKRFVNRTQDLDPITDLPAAAILTPDETSERADKSGALDRRLSVMVVLTLNAEAADDVDDVLDDWAELIEERLKQTPIGAARRMTLTATALDLPDVEEGETWLGYLVLEYEAEIQGSP